MAQRHPGYDAPLPKDCRCAGKVESAEIDIPHEKGAHGCVYRDDTPFCYCLEWSKNKGEKGKLLKHTPGDTGCALSATGYRSREGDQPVPVPNDKPIIHELVIQDVQARLALGTKRYGVGLQPHNGRNALRDAYEEALDLAAYLRQRIWEEENPNV